MLGLDVGGCRAVIVGELLGAHIFEAVGIGQGFEFPGAADGLEFHPIKVGDANLVSLLGKHLDR